MCCCFFFLHGRILAGWVRQYRKLNTDLEAVVDEWASSLFMEMDYEAEARNGARFRELFGSQPGVVIPRVYPELSTKRVLLMEWIDVSHSTALCCRCRVHTGVQ